MENEVEECGASSSKALQYSECVVCGSVKGTLHYGAITCQSCKVFFLRAVLTNGPFVCDKTNSCIYPADKCRACRYLRCISAGMIPNIVGLREGCSKRKAVDNPSTMIALAKAIVPMDRKNFVNRTSTFFRDLSIEDIEQLAASMVRTERYCDNDQHHNATINPKFEYNFDLDLIDALRNPLLICERTPIGYTKTDPVMFNAAETAQRIFCRQVLCYVDYFLACEDLWDLSIADRLRLCAAQWSSTIMVNIVYSTYKYKCETLAFIAGYRYYRQNNDEVVDVHSNFVGYASDLAQRNIISVFKEVNMTEEEYTFLKKILFLTTNALLSDQGREIVGNARRKYEVAFTKYLTWKHPLTAATRLWKIMSVIPYFKILGVKNDKTVTRSIILNTVNMSGNLAYDIHIREV